ncbi:hypothetical protein BDA96_09G155500 [Sorghum bicolor]|uniref:Uncharacterized protein n=1 Tax=Sorghum bicolor TaxID=4558 RepID=A0A921Q9X5_SORBI|nr:hypothetical protein BDA96_09G155500 [Sorghum bicolor]
MPSVCTWRSSAKEGSAAHSLSRPGWNPSRCLFMFRAIVQTRRRGGAQIKSLANHFSEQF